MSAPGVSTVRGTGLEYAFVVLLMLAVLACLPAAHAVSGFDTPDVFDQGVSAGAKGAALSPELSLAAAFALAWAIACAASRKSARASREYFSAQLARITCRPAAVPSIARQRHATYARRETDDDRELGLHARTIWFLDPLGAAGRSGRDEGVFLSACNGSWTREQGRGV